MSVSAGEAPSFPHQKPAQAKKLPQFVEPSLLGICWFQVICKSANANILPVRFQLGKVLFKFVFKKLIPFIWDIIGLFYYCNFSVVYLNQWFITGQMSRRGVLVCSASQPETHICLHCTGVRCVLVTQLLFHSEYETSTQRINQVEFRLTESILEVSNDSHSCVPGLVRSFHCYGSDKPGRYEEINLYSES